MQSHSVDIDRGKFKDGWAQAFLDEYENTQSLRGEELLAQIVQRGSDHRGDATRVDLSAVYHARHGQEIALHRDDEYITDPEAIGWAVRNKTNFTDVQIRFESLNGIDTEQIRTTVEAIMDSSPSDSDPDTWLSELAGWIDENSVLVKRVLRDVRREFSEEASLDELSEALEPALDGESLETEDVATDSISDTNVTEIGTV